MAKSAGILGVLAFISLGFALVVFGMLNQEFSFSNDYISKLGAKGEPYAIWWNLIGFVLVGILLMGFGFTYGKVIKDKLVGIFIALFGLGFALTAIPMDMLDSNTPVSKAHIVAICLALASWLFGLARMGSNTSLEKKIRRRANVAATLLTISMFGFVFGLWSMPSTHRLVFGVVFGWTLITAADLLLRSRTKTGN